MKNGSVGYKIKLNCSVLESGGNRFSNSSICAHFKITFFKIFMLFLSAFMCEMSYRTHCACLVALDSLLMRESDLATTRGKQLLNNSRC